MKPLMTALVLVLAPLTLPADDSRVELQLKVDGEDGSALPCRVHLYDAGGKPQAAPDLPFWKDHFVCDGRVALQLTPGRYRYEIERGPEWQRIAGSLDLAEKRQHTLHVPMRRVASLPKHGWYSGDLHVHRPLQDIELLMRAEDLHIAPVITWWNARNLWSDRERPKTLLTRFDGNRFYHAMAGEDERGGGALLYFHLDEPLPISKASREQPSSLQFVDDARKRNKNVWIDVEKPFWWDLPLWLASGQMDSIGIANNHMHRSGVYPGEAWGRARDEKRFPAPLGNGQWTQEIYYHLLNCGFRLTPSAGSASGVLPNPVGYNRVYVQVDGDLSYEKWWAGLKAGRCFVTNGPLLLCNANEQLPGATFRVARGRPLKLKLDVEMISNDPVKQIEVVANGVVTETVRVDREATNRRTIELTVHEPGWFLIRAVADVGNTFRFASTGPFYVEIGDGKRRVSKASVRFFQQWLDERVARLEKALPVGMERDAVLGRCQEAKRFWDELARTATSE